MKATILWAHSVAELYLESPERDQNEIQEKLQWVQRFPRLYPARGKGKRFRRHHWFCTRHWLVYYKVVGNTVYIRGLWPARIP